MLRSYHRGAELSGNHTHQCAKFNADRCRCRRHICPPHKKQNANDIFDKTHTSICRITNEQMNEQTDSKTSPSLSRGELDKYYYCVGSGVCQTWTSFANTNIPASQQNSATTLQACQSACQSNQQCIGIDWVSNAAFGTQCRLSFPWSGSKNIGQAPGTTHYDLNRNCQGQVFTILTEFYQTSRRISRIIIVQLCRAHPCTPVWVKCSEE